MITHIRTTRGDRMLTSRERDVIRVAIRDRWGGTACVALDAAAAAELRLELDRAAATRDATET